MRPSPVVVSLPRVAAGMLRPRHSRRVSRAHTAFPRWVSLWSGEKSCRRRDCALPGLVGGGVLRMGTLKREVNSRHSKRDCNVPQYEKLFPSAAAPPAATTEESDLLLQSRAETCLQGPLLPGAGSGGWFSKGSTTC